MRIAFSLLSVACLASSAFAQSTPDGVVFVGDVPTIDKATLEAAELSLPPAVSLGPQSAPRRAPTKQAAPVRPVAHVTPAPTATAQPAASGGLLGKLKSSWPFGKKDEAAQPAVDPFAQAKLKAREALAPAAAIRDTAVRPIPAVAPSQPTQQAAFARPVGQPPAHSRTRPGRSSRPGRTGGLATRTQSKPSGGLLSGLFGESKPQPKPAAAVTPKPIKPAPKAARMASNPPRVAPLSTTKPAPRTPSTPRHNLAAQLAAQARQRGSITVGKRTASPGVAVMISDDAPAAPRPIAPPVVLPTAPIEKIEPPKPIEPPKVLVESKPTPKPPKAAPLPIAPLPQAKPQAKRLAIAAQPTPTKPVIVENKLETKIVEAKTVATPEPIAPIVEPAAPVEELAEVVTAPEPERVVVASQPAVQPVVLPTAPQPVAIEPQPLRPARVVRTVSDIEPSERSRALLAEAHEFAADAADYEGHSSVIQRCRYVLAIDRSPQARDYANQLASWALTKRGELLNDQGRLEEAIVDYREALVCDNECWKAEHALGVIAAGRGESHAATRHFDRVIELNPEHAKAFANRAALAVQSGDYQTALADYAEAIAIDPDLTVAHTGRGRICHLVGRLDEGLRHLDAAAVLDPSDPAIATGRGDLLTDLGRYGQAITAYRRAIRLNPGLAQAHRNLAWLHATCPVTAFRDGDAALASAEIAEQLATTDDMTLDTKAAALATLGRFDEAAQLQQEAIELAPESQVAPYQERLAMYERGQAFTSKPITVEQATYMK